MISCNIFTALTFISHDVYITHRIHVWYIYANIWGILMGSMLPYIAYMDPIGLLSICSTISFVFGEKTQKD